MPDHPTPLSKLTHTGTPVPFAMYHSQAPEAAKDVRFTEAQAEAAGLFVERACELMPVLLSEKG